MDIYLADSKTYIVSEKPETAAQAYEEAKSQEAKTLALFASKDDVVISAETFTVTVEIDPTAAETADCKVYPITDTYKEGDIITFTAVPAGAYSFVQWEDGDNNVLGTALTYKLTIAKNSTLKAVFTL